MLKSLLIGEDPLDRERIWQRLRGARRLLRVSRSWAGTVDNCLWDLAGKVAGLPVYKLIGAVRDKIPCYWSAMEVPAEQNVRDALQAKEMGYYGYKFHSYKGPRDDIANFEDVRRAVGDDFDLMQDAAATYTLSEALKVGGALEELGFLWFEEPVPDTDLAELQTLVRELDIPILATERFSTEMVPLVAQYLRAGATDLLRGNSAPGITTVLKLAHFAEMYNTNVELVSESDKGLYGLVGTHVSCAISNTTYLEDWRDRHQLGKECGILNAPTAVDGCMVPPDGPGFGAEIDWDWMRKRTVAEL
jgi:L-alanine-DL-glutamate epimerase-like enolase superfamily enzyme